MGNLTNVKLEQVDLVAQNLTARTTQEILNPYFIVGIINMARKTKKTNIHEFTVQIHSTKRAGTRFASMDNWSEKEAKNKKHVCCHDCRYFLMGCSEYIGKYHKPCELFEWW